MNLLFLTMGRFDDITKYGLYTDLLRKFCNNGHNVYVVSPSERSNNQKTHLIEQRNCKILKVKTGNIQKTNIVEKGISTVLLEFQFVNAIKKWFFGINFDLVLYSTPPITLAGVVKFIKKRDNAKTYLLLKDIFPQNAVDIGMMSKKGLKSILYKYFRAKEKQLYNLSDVIGCMSKANIDFVLKNNPQLSTKLFEVCPNAIEPRNLSITYEECLNIRGKYGIPLEKKVFVYGGNLGKPQGIDFLIECLKNVREIENAFFFIVGSGTEYKKLEEFVISANQSNIKLMASISKEDYDQMIAACDVGLIFLDHRFTIPNFPSRLLSYMQAKIPVIACTDPNTDIGDVIVNGKFGWWCESNSTDNFKSVVEEALVSNLPAMGKCAYSYLIDNYNVEKNYELIIKHCEEARSVNVDY